jgi:hypothetical protein
MKTCPICLRASRGDISVDQTKIGIVYRFECDTQVTRINGQVTECKATDVCLLGAKRIQNAAQCLYDAFGDGHAHVFTEQREALKEWRRITMDRDGKECAP